MFAGIDNKARKAVRGYVGPEGVARLAKKLYMGVDGKARLCWEAGGGSGGGESSGVRAYLYNGVKLPQLPEWDMDKYPYAYIMCTKAGVYYLAFPSEERTSTASDSIMLYSDDLKYKYTDGAWVETTVYLTRGDAVWSNYDIHYGEAHDLAGEIYCEASDPVPLWNYNGMELPELPEWGKMEYPYACIARTTMGAYAFGASKSAVLVRDKDSGVRCDWEPPSLQCSLVPTAMYGTGEWGELEYTETLSGASLYPVITMWANYDVAYNGKVIVTASAPQPVYM